jgi:glycosyltransferase involved in cell wall biosynthesis
MEIIFLIYGFSAGGSEKQLLLNVAGLRREGYRCSVHWLVDIPVHARLQGLLNECKALGVTFHAPAARSRVGFKVIWEIRERLLVETGTLLWTWGYRADFVAIFLLLSGCRSKILGSQRSACERRIWRFQWFWMLIARTHCAFISNSFLNVRQISKVVPRIAAKTAVIYNAVEDEYFASSVSGLTKPDRLKIVMLGNQSTYIKGYDLAVEIGEKIKLSGLSIVISIGGVPSDAGSLAKTIAARGLSGIVVLEGAIHDPLAFFLTGDIFLMLSRFEGTPNALLEAMALGLPAICTRVGDVAAFAQDGANIRLIDTEAEAAFVAIQELWQDWPKTQVLAVAGRELCREKFSTSAMIKATSEVLREIEKTRAYQVKTA